MSLRFMLTERNKLAKLSGVPKTIIIDICSGKTSIEKCCAKTVLKNYYCLRMYNRRINDEFDGENNI